MSTRTTWHEAVWDLFDDLEQQAEGLALDERAAEVDALATAEYAEVTAQQRWQAATGSVVAVRALGGVAVRGRVTRAGDGWVVLDDEQQRCWVVPTTAVLSVTGLPARSLHPDARGLRTRLGMASVLRRLAEERTTCVLHLRDGSRLELVLGRVGADFLEGWSEPNEAVGAPTLEVVPFGALAAVQEQR